MLAEPIPKRHAIEASGTIHAPWLTNRNLLAETVELPGDLCEVGGFGETDVGQETARDRAFDVVRGVAFVVGIVGADAELADQGSHAVLARTDPLTADLHDMPSANRHVERAPAYAIACLEHEKRIYSAPFELAARHQTREPRTDDDHVDMPYGRTRVLPPGGANQTR